MREASSVHHGCCWVEKYLYIYMVMTMICPSRRLIRPNPSGQIRWTPDSCRCRQTPSGRVRFSSGRVPARKFDRVLHSLKSWASVDGMARKKTTRMTLFRRPNDGGTTTILFHDDFGECDFISYTPNRRLEGENVSKTENSPAISSAFQEKEQDSLVNFWVLQYYV